LATNLGKSKVGDFNGDGLIDFIMKPWDGSTNWKVILNNGNFTFSHMGRTGIYAVDDPDTNKDDDKENYIVCDFNNDGKSDIIVTDAHYSWHSDWWTTWKEFDFVTTYWYASLGNASTGNCFKEVKRTISKREDDAYAKFFITGDYNGDGRTDLINYGYNCYTGINKPNQKWYMHNLPNNGNENDVITCVANGLNQKMFFSYKPLTNDSVYKATEKATSKTIVVKAPLYVVSEMKTGDALGGFSTIINKYENATAHKLGLGFLGFCKTEQYNELTGMKSVTKNEWDPTYFGLSKQLTGTLYGTDTLSRTSSYYKIVPSSADSKVKFTYPNFVQSVDKQKAIVVNTMREYDANGNLTLQNGIVNNGFYKTKQELQGFDVFGNPETVTTTTERSGEKPITRVQRYLYNEKGRVTSSVLNGLTTTYGYNEFGKDTVLVTSSGADSRKTSIRYTADGRFAKLQKNALGYTSSATFDDWGKPLTQTDANGNVTVNKYDSWGNLTEVNTPDKHIGKNKIDWVREGDSQAPQYALYYTENIVDGRFVSAEYFDTLGRSLRKVSTGYNGAKFWTDIKYNNLGQVTEVSNPYPEGGSPSKFTVSTYDYLGRVETQKTPDEVTVRNLYSGNTITTTYSTGETYEKTSDATGQLILAKDPGGSIEYSYNSENKSRQIQSPGSIVQIKYDEYGRQDTLIDPNAGTMAYQYNLFGELVSQTDARGKTITSTFDKLGRIETKTADGVTTKYYYDKGEKALGTTDSIVRSDGTAISFKYTTDGLHRVKEETRRKDGISLTYGYDYNDKGLLSRLTYPGGFAVNYGYTESNDLEEIRDARTETLLWKLDKTNPKNGQIEEASYGDNLKVTYGYNTNDQLNRIYVPGVIDFNYQYNEKQQLQWREELYFEKDAWAGFKEEFSYDPVNRLETASVGGVEKLRMRYADSNNTANDRITYKSDAGDYAYQSGNHRISELTTVTGYTPPSHYLSYTAEGKVDTIREVTDSTTVKRFIFGYGIDNQRFSMKYTVNDTLRYTRYYADIFEKEVMADGTERNLSYIYANGTLVGINIQTAGTDSTFFVFVDRLGSLRCITDAEGRVRQRLSFDAWGNRRNPITGEKDTTLLPSNGGVGGGLFLARGFTGHEHLDEMTLINMNGRLYDPAIGMFISPDNYIQAPEFTQSFNRYAYCLNNPLMYTDPSGYTWLSHFWNWVKEGFDNLGDWLNKNDISFQVGTNFSARNNVPFASASVDGRSVTVGYNVNTGNVGFGNGSANDLYYPSVNYGASEQIALQNIEWARQSALKQAYAAKTAAIKEPYRWEPKLPMLPFDGFNNGGQSSSHLDWDSDGDGILTLGEANSWYRNGNGQAITVDASRITFTTVNPTELSRDHFTAINFEMRLEPVHGLVYGSLSIKLVGNNKVMIEPNEYDFRVGAANGSPWFSSPRGFVRNVGTVLGNVVSGSGQPYWINFSGLATINFLTIRPMFDPTMKF
jgi:RHS repeat-associated protein